MDLTASNVSDGGPVREFVPEREERIRGLCVSNLHVSKTVTAMNKDIAPRVISKVGPRESVKSNPNPSSMRLSFLFKLLPVFLFIAPMLWARRR
jgi:hypothetical protein